MSRCACVGATCQCVLLDSPTIDFSGAGSAAVPYTGDIIPTGVAPLLLSTDPGNALILGTDGLLKTGGARTLFSSAAAVPSVPPGPFTTYASFPVAANQMATDGDRLVVQASFVMNAGFFDPNGFVFTFGGALLALRAAVAARVTFAHITFEFFRTGPLVGKVTGQMWFDDNNGGGFPVTPEIQGVITAVATNFAIPNTFLLQLETASGLPNEIVGHSLTVEYHPAP